MLIHHPPLSPIYKVFATSSVLLRHGSYRPCCATVYQCTNVQVSFVTHITSYFATSTHPHHHQHHQNNSSLGVVSLMCLISTQCAAAADNIAGDSGRGCVAAQDYPSRRDLVCVPDGHRYAPAI